MAKTPFGKSKAPPFGKEKDTAETGEASAPESKFRAGKRGAASTRNRKTSRR